MQIIVYLQKNCNLLKCKCCKCWDSLRFSVPYTILSSSTLHTTYFTSKIKNILLIAKASEWFVLIESAQVVFRTQSINVQSCLSQTHSMNVLSRINYMSLGHYLLNGIFCLIEKLWETSKQPIIALLSILWISMNVLYRINYMLLVHHRHYFLFLSTLADRKGLNEL